MKFWAIIIDSMYLLLDIWYMFYLVLQDGKTALMGACAGGHLSVAQYLVDRGVDINAKDHVSYDLSSFTSKDAPWKWWYVYW